MKTFININDLKMNRISGFDKIIFMYNFLETSLNYM